MPDGLLPALVREVRRDQRRRTLADRRAAAAAAAVVVGTATFTVAGLNDSGDGSSAAPSATLVEPRDRPADGTRGGRHRHPGHARPRPRSTGARSWSSPAATTASAYAAPPEAYALVVHTRDGHSEQVATWKSLPGRTMRLAAATVGQPLGASRPWRCGRRTAYRCWSSPTELAERSRTSTAAPTDDRHQLGRRCREHPAALPRPACTPNSPESVVEITNAPSVDAPNPIAEERGHPVPPPEQQDGDHHAGCRVEQESGTDHVLLPEHVEPQPQVHGSRHEHGNSRQQAQLHDTSPSVSGRSDDRPHWRDVRGGPGVQVPGPEARARPSCAPRRTPAGRRGRARCAVRTAPPQAAVHRGVGLVLPRAARALGPPPVCRSCTSSAAISTLLVAGSKTSTPKRCAPAYAAASARFFTTERVRVGGATFSDTASRRPGRRSPASAAAASPARSSGPAAAPGCR